MASKADSSVRWTAGVPLVLAVGACTPAAAAAAAADVSELWRTGAGRGLTSFCEMSSRAKGAAGGIRPGCST
jgi:hypothetical protein